MRENADYLYDRMIAVFETKPAAWWMELLAPLDIAVEVLAENWEVSKDPQVWANGCLSYLECPNGSTYIVPNTPVEFSGVERAQTRHAGNIGCDTREILADLGYSQQEIEDLLQRNIAAEKRII